MLRNRISDEDIECGFNLLKFTIINLMFVNYSLFQLVGELSFNPAEAEEGFRRRTQLRYCQSTFYVKEGLEKSI